MVERVEKITLGEMRDARVRGLLTYSHISNAAIGFG